MIADDKLWPLVDVLLNRSRANDVRWKIADYAPATYELDLPEGSSLVLTYNSPTTDPDFVELRLFNRDGQLARVWLCSEEDPQWPTVSALFREAERTTTGWDEALSDLEQALQQPGPVGLGEKGTRRGSSATGGRQSVGAMIFTTAVGLLRMTAAKSFRTSDGASSALPGALWYQKRKDWLQLAQLLGEYDRQRGHFHPSIEPDKFEGRDDMLVHAAAEILRLYVWSSLKNPDFEAIQTKFNLPDPYQVKALLRTYEFSGS